MGKIKDRFFDEINSENDLHMKIMNLLIESLEMFGNTIKKFMVK